MDKVQRFVIVMPEIDKAVSFEVGEKDLANAIAFPDEFLNRYFKPCIAQLMAEYTESLAVNHG